MLLAIEGLDRTGKSNLARGIELDTNGTVIHRGPPQRHPLEEYELELLGYDPLKRGTLVLDRWHVGERVWPSLFRRTSQYDGSQRRHTEMFLQSRGAVLVYCERAKDELRIALREEGEPAYDVDEALGLYDIALNDVACPLVRYTHGGDQGKIIGAMHKATKRVAPVHKVTHAWIGDPAPDALVVCESGGADVPLYPWPGTPEVARNDAVVTRSNWKRLAACETADPSGRPIPLHSLWLALQRPHVASVGDEADAALQRARVPHDRFPTAADLPGTVGA